MRSSRFRRICPSGRPCRRSLWSIAVLVLCVCMLLSSCTVSQQHHVLHIGVFAGSNWDVPGNEDYQIIDDVIARFEQSHPGFVVEYDSGVRKSDYSEWLAASAIEGRMPDVFMVLDQDFSLYAQRGALKDLNGLIRSDPDFAIDDFYPSTIELGQQNGIQYGIPYESNPKMMFVNVSLLEQNGIPVPDHDWDLETLKSIVSSMTRDTDGDGRLDQFGIYNYSWQNAAAAYGAEIFKENGTGTNLSSPEMSQALSLTRELDAIQQNTQITQEDFDLGKVAFSPFTYAEYKTYQPYPWKVKRLSQFEWTCIPMPSSQSGRSGTVMDSLLLSINSKTSCTREAWDLIKMLTTDEQTQELLMDLSAGLPSARISSPSRTETADQQDPSTSGTSQSVHLPQTESTRSEEALMKELSENQEESLDLSMIESVMEDARVVHKFPGYEQMLEQIDARIRSDVGQTQDLDLFLIDLDKLVSQYLLSRH